MQHLVQSMVVIRAFEMVAANLRPWLTWLMRESGTHRVQDTRCGGLSVYAGGVAVASRLGFALLVGCDKVDAAFALGLFGFPSSQVSSLSNLSFPFSDPSPSVFGSL
jgi:hypothetical protein